MTSASAATVVLDEALAGWPSDRVPRARVTCSCADPGECGSGGCDHRVALAAGELSQTELRYLLGLAARYRMTLRVDAVGPELAITLGAGDGALAGDPDGHYPLEALPSEAGDELAACRRRRGHAGRRRPKLQLTSPIGDGPGGSAA